MHGTAPEYLTEVFMPVTDVPGRRHLRSAAIGGIIVPRTNQDVRAKKFSVNGPVIWNSLPTYIRYIQLSLE